MVKANGVLKKDFVTWLDVENCVGFFAKNIKSKFSTLKNPVIVPIVRGGLCLGVCLSHKLKASYNINIPLLPVAFQSKDFQTNDSDKLKSIVEEYNEVFIVEDLVDSGETLLSLDKAIASNVEKTGKFIEFYALFGNQKAICFTTNYWKDIKADTWYVFPWEMKELC